MDQQPGEAESQEARDAELQAALGRARNGCEESKARVLEFCRGYLLAIATREIDSKLRPKLAASDAVQDTLVEAQRDLSDFRGGTEPELLEWARRILQNNLRDAQRWYFEAQKRQLDKEQVLASGSVVAPGAQKTASAIVSDDEESVRLRAALLRLPENYQEVIELRNWQLESFDEIGRRMDRSAEAVRKLWTRAIERLQRELGAE